MDHNDEKAINALFPFRIGRSYYENVGFTQFLVDVVALLYCRLIAINSNYAHVCILLLTILKDSLYCQYWSFQTNNASTLRWTGLRKDVKIWRQTYTRKSLYGKV